MKLLKVEGGGARAPVPHSWRRHCRNVAKECKNECVVTCLLLWTCSKGFLKTLKNPNPDFRLSHSRNLLLLLLLPFSLISCVYNYAMYIAINDVAGERVYT